MMTDQGEPGNRWRRKCKLPQTQFRQREDHNLPLHAAAFDLGGDFRRRGAFDFHQHPGPAPARQQDSPQRRDRRAAGAHLRERQVTDSLPDTTAPPEVVIVKNHQFTVMRFVDVHFHIVHAAPQRAAYGSQGVLGPPATETTVRNDGGGASVHRGQYSAILTNLLLETATRYTLGRGKWQVFLHEATRVERVFMIVSRSSGWARKQMLLAVVDALLAAFAMVMAVTLRLGAVAGYDYLLSHSSSLLAAWGMFVVAFYLCGLYEPESLQHPGRMLAGTGIAVVLGGVLVTSFFYATLTTDIIGRGVFLGFAVFVFVAVVANRMLYMAASRRGVLGQRCLIIGANGEARRAIELIREHPHTGMRVLGLIHCGRDQERIGKFVDGFPILGDLDTLGKFIELYDVERLILAATPEDEPVLLKRLRVFRYRGLAIVDLVTLHEELAQQIPLDYINDEWLFLASMNNSRIHVRRVKRVVDLLVAMLGLVLSAPIAALAAVLVRLTSSGPVLYRQERLGRDSVPFVLMKFRTMVANAEEKSGPVWAIDDDPRITGVGKWLRKLRIDEIPQLINVLRGEMSLVGPRPEREVFIRELSEKIPFYAERLLVPPGITGWAQVKAPYAASVEDTRVKLQFDLYYIKHMSLALDLFIFLKTIKTMLFGRERHHPQRVTTSTPRTGQITTATVNLRQPPATGTGTAPSTPPLGS